MLQTQKKFLIFLLILTSTFFTLYPKSVYAEAWGSNFGATLVDQIMTTVKRQIEGAILGTQKMIAIQILNSRVGQLIGGVSGGQPLFITNFNEFLYQNPRQNANLYMNDFFSVTTRGRGSSANYISNTKDSGAYSAYLTNIGRRATVDRDIVGYNNFDDFGGIQAFNRGDKRAFNAFFSNPMNNPIGYTMKATEVFADELERQQKIAEMKALSPGILPSESNGTIVAPATIIASELNNTADLPRKAIADATNPGELLSGVVSSMANKLVSNMIQKGVGEIQSKISREINKVDRQISGEINKTMKTIGPAVQFAGTVKRIEKTLTKTPPPPAAIPPDP